MSKVCKKVSQKLLMESQYSFTNLQASKDWLDYNNYKYSFGFRFDDLSNAVLVFTLTCIETEIKGVVLEPPALLVMRAIS